MTFADALKALPGDIRNRVCFRIWMAVENTEAITLAVDRILTMSEKQKFQIMETILAEPPEPMNNVTIEYGPNTLKSKWLDPECRDGCQSLVLKAELDRVNRKNMALSGALQVCHNESRIWAGESANTGLDLACAAMVRIHSVTEGALRIAAVGSDTSSQGYSVDFWRGLYCKLAELHNAALDREKALAEKVAEESRCLKRQNEALREAVTAFIDAGKDSPVIHGYPAALEKGKAALKPDAGRDFIPREQVKPLVDELPNYRSALYASGCSTAPADLLIHHAKNLSL